MSNKPSHHTKKLDIVVNTDSFSSLCAGAVSVISKVKNWKPDNIGFQLFKGGFNNHLLRCYLKDNPYEALLIRVYGKNTEQFIDRNAEIRNMQIMCDAGLCAPLHCAFTNGLCYDFTPGEVLDTQLVRDPDISKLIAVKLARMHSIEPNADGINPQASLFSNIYNFLHLIPESIPDPIEDIRYKSIIGSKEKLSQEIEHLKECLIKIESPVVFCHNDLLLKNIIYDRKKKKITFIDYEFSSYSYQAFDIGNHFCEFSGVETFDPKLYPNKDFQIRWLKIYLEEWYFANKLNPDDITEETIETMYIIVNKFALASHLIWGTWALVQLSNSKSDMDYFWYASARLGEYFSRKEEFLSL